MAIVRFITDSSLASLARRLRVLGYDVVVARDAGLERVCALARAEGRTVLTLSTRVPAACACVPRFVVERGRLETSLRELTRRFEADAAPFSRCTACNHPLAPAEGAGSFPRGGAPHDAGAVRHCPSCGRWYWHGSHVDRLREWLERTLGRPVPAPE